MSSQRVAVVLAAAVALVLPVNFAKAQVGTYPNRPIRFVVPMSPGGGTDYLARLLAERMQSKLGQPVVVENKPGAGGIIGTDAVAKSAPDGYTLLVNINALTISPALGESLPYDALKDLFPVAKMVITPFILVVNPSVPATNVQQLVAYSKSNPGKFFYASPGTSTPLHLNMEWFKDITGMDAIHVPYKGAVPALADVVAGRAQVMLGIGASAMPHIQAGKLRAIAAQGRQRLSYLNEVPTFQEAGVSNFGFDIWYAIFAPSATPKVIVNLLHAEIMRVLGIQEVRKSLSGLGFEFVPEVSPEAFLSEMVAETNHWKKLVSDKGLKSN